jgi:guanylate kinase
MNKKLDPELMAYFFDIKDRITKDHEEYIGSHPEIKQILVDFLTKLLMTKPDNIYSFTTEYFSFYEKRSLKEHLNPLVIVGCKHSGKKDLANYLVSLYPQYFERNVFYTTKPLSEEEARNSNIAFISKEDFIEENAKGNFVTYQSHGEYFCKAVNRNFIKEVTKKGKICIITLTLENSKVFHNASTHSNFILLLPSSVERIKERIINKQKISMDTIEETMNQIKSEIEISSNIDFYFGKLLNDHTPKFNETFCEYVKKVYPMLQF